MPVIRATWFYKVGENGWSETHYSTKPTLQNAMVDALAAGTIFRNLRAKDVAYFGVRVSDDLVKGDSLFTAIDPGFQFNTRAGLGSANAAWDALQVRLESGTLKRRIFAIRGIEDNAQQAASFLYTSNLTARFPAFVSEMESGRWGMRTQDTAAPRVIISTFAPGPGTTLLVITTATPHGLETNDLAYFGGSDRAGLLRGFHRVIKVDANTLWVRSAAVINLLLGTWYVRKVTYGVQSYTSCSQPVKLSKRDTGRVPFGPRGRRSARRLV